MGGVADYRRIVMGILVEYASVKPSYGDIEVETIFDDVRDHYEILYAGWDKQKRVHGAILHVDIRDGKIWIQHDGTEDGIANELMAAGVPKEHIVLAWHAPSERRLTGFAVG